MLQRHLIGSNGASFNNHWQFEGFNQCGLKWYVRQRDHWLRQEDKNKDMKGIMKVQEAMVIIMGINKNAGMPGNLNFNSG